METKNPKRRNGRGVVLAGAFLEQRADGTRVRSEGDLTFYPLGDYHRISGLVRLWESDPSGETWTLFGAGPKLRHWGYSVNGEHVPSEIYHARDGQGGEA